MSARPETGTMKFENDWTGVFVRGDDAFGFAVTLQTFLETEPVEANAIPRAVLTGLLDLLLSCNEGVPTFERSKVQQMRQFEECLVSPK